MTMKKLNKILSIIVPIYNIGEKLLPIINSLNNLEKIYLKEIEVIFVNDGSLLNENNLIKTKLNIENYQIINSINTGTMKARYIGQKQSNGEYIWFIDGDDTFDNKSIQILIDKIKNTKELPDIFAFSWYEHIYMEGGYLTNYIHAWNIEFNIANLNLIDISFIKLIVDNIKQSSINTKIFKKEFLDENNFLYLDNFSLNEDTFLWFQMLFKFNSIIYRHSCLYLLSKIKWKFRYE